MRLKDKRRIDRMDDMKAGVTYALKKMMEMAEEGYEPRPISMQLIIPRMGKQMRAHKRELSAHEKAKHKLMMMMMMMMMMRKAQAKAKAKAKASPDNSADIEDTREEPLPFLRFRGIVRIYKEL